ncbi:cytochrome P450 [Streptomyces bambusae]|uniref:cytochrome P450 family protein n=1 Tax=Streptomyces bambusae TaxID=1550616 RepID=UPI001CFC479D|nr:cytochrome P450 [Streptomyces bambusae]MCB5165369.1 cytochrome P450 [Streptomyces bambusae]
MADEQPLVLDPQGADREREHAELRRRGPLTRVDVLGVTAWSVAEPALLKRLLTDPRLSKDAARHWPLFPDEIVGKWPLAHWVGVTNMFTAHGTDHQRLRRLVAPAFAVRRMNALAPRIGQITDALLTGLAALPADRPADLREMFAFPLPIRVIGLLLGLPERMRHSFGDHVNAVFDTTLDADRAAANMAELYEVLDGLVKSKRAEPADDLASALIATRDTEGDGSALTEQELLDTLLLVISAGYETTVNLLDQAVTALLGHPYQLELLRSGRASWERAIEETLRFQAPIAHVPMYYAVEDIPVGDGLRIRAGEAVLPSYGAAGRDPGVHGETADAFDITRARTDHLSFGHGAHYCIGAHLARLEAGTALPALFARFPALRLAEPAGGLPPLPSLIANGHRRLPVFLHG